MTELMYLESLGHSLSEEEMYSINGGLVVTVGGVALVLTWKGLAMAASIIAGAYTAGYVVGKGWAYYQ